MGEKGFTPLYDLEFNKSCFEIKERTNCSGNADGVDTGPESGGI